MIDDLEARALAAIAHHERQYGVAAPDRLRAFYRDDPRQYHRRWARQALPLYGNEHFQLALTPPTWLDKDDDAINGPGGEWADAGYHLPIFVSAQSLWVVVDLRTPEAPVGWYEEESFRDGVVATGLSLNAFLAGLATQPPAGEEASAMDDDGDDDTDWAEDFDDDSPRAFDVIRD